MMMIVDMSDTQEDFTSIQNKIEELGKSIGVILKHKGKIFST